MAAKKSTDVMIAGKIYTLSGYEEEGYLQRVATYINAKISEIVEREEFRRIPNDMKSILIQLNIADDYFKAKTQCEDVEDDYKKAEKDIFDLKHELVDTQMKVEELLDKLESERKEKTQKNETEQAIEVNYKRLKEDFQRLTESAKIADEKNRQFEEMLRLSELERRELEAKNKELVLVNQQLTKQYEELKASDKELANAKKEWETSARELETAKRELEAQSQSEASKNKELVTKNKELATENKELETAKNELEIAKKVLETQNKELSTTNKDLKASNQELMSQNKELATANKDLNSANRELRINKEKLESALADALFGAVRKNDADGQMNTELSEEELSELLALTGEEPDRYEDLEEESASGDGSQNSQKEDGAEEDNQLEDREKTEDSQLENSDKTENDQLEDHEKTEDNQLEDHEKTEDNWIDDHDKAEDFQIEDHRKIEGKAELEDKTHSVHENDADEQTDAVSTVPEEKIVETENADDNSKETKKAGQTAENMQASVHHAEQEQSIDTPHSDTGTGMERSEPYKTSVSSGNEDILEKAGKPFPEIHTPTAEEIREIEAEVAQLRAAEEQADARQRKQTHLKQSSGLQAIARQLEEDHTGTKQEKRGVEDGNKKTGQAVAGFQESSVWKEVSEDDDPELQELARQIAELERQEREEKKTAKDTRKAVRK